jgi:hypothetical protein
VIGSVITRLWWQNAFLGLLSSFWTVLAALCLLVLTDWIGECFTVVIAGREGFRVLLPSRYGDTAHREGTFRFLFGGDGT